MPAAGCSRAWEKTGNKIGRGIGPKTGKTVGKIALKAGKASAVGQNVVTESVTRQFNLQYGNRMSYSLVIFDWDGTIMDSTHSIVAAIQAAARDLGLRVPSVAQASWVIGLSLDEALHRAVPDLTASQLPRFLERYRIHYLLKDPELRTFEGITDMLDELKAQGVLMAVATGKSRIGLDRVLNGMNLGHYFDASRTADQTFSKPHPQMLQEILEELDVPADQAVMVGDTSHDIQMAQSAGMDSIAVTYGAHTAEELAASQPTLIARTPAQLQNFLLEHCKKVAV